jgi:hypothetical protein
LKWLLAIVATVALLAAVAIVALPWLVDVPRVQALVAANASQALGRAVRFASLSVAVFPLPSVTLRNLEIADDPEFGAAPFVTLDRGRLRLRLRPLLSGRIEFAELVLEKPTITVLRDARGRLNVATLGAGGEPKPGTRTGRAGTGASGGGAALALPTAVKVEDGVLIYSASKAGGATRYRIEDLALTLDATGPQVAFEGSARATPGDVILTFSEGLVTVTPGRPLAEAPVRAKLAIDGKDVTPFVAAALGPAIGVGGTIQGALTVAGTVASPTAAGDVKLSRLTVARTSPQCPEPKRRTLAVPAVTLNAAWRDARLTAQPLHADLRKGTFDARLTADVERGVRIRLDDMAVKAMPLEPVLVDFLCLGYAVTGPLDLAGALTFAAAKPLETLSGPGSLKIGAGRIVGKQALRLVGDVVRVAGTVSTLLSGDLSPAVFTSPVEFDSITGTYRITDGIVSTRDLLYTSRLMAVSVVGDYAIPTSVMNLDVVVNHGRGEVRAKVTGTAAAPAIRIVPGSVLRSVDQDKVERGLRDLLRQFR